MNLIDYLEESLEVNNSSNVSTARLKAQYNSSEKQTLDDVVASRSGGRANKFYSSVGPSDRP